MSIISEEYPSETGWGGIATYSYELAQYLSSQEIRVSVISLTYDLEDKTEKINPYLTIYRLRLSSYNLIHLPLIWRLNKYLHGFAFRVYKKIKKIHLENPIDLIETPEFRANSLYCHWLLPRIPTVVRLHTSYRLIAELNNLPRFNIIKEWQENYVLKKALRISAPSHAIIPLTLQKAGITRKTAITYIPNPINLRTFSQVSLDKKIPFSVIFVGRLEKRKGIDLIVEAIPTLFNVIPELHFTFLGEDGTNEEGESYQKLLGKAAGPQHQMQIVFKKLLRHQVPQEIARHKLAFFPSIWENCPYVLLESMAVKTPAMVGKDGGMSEIVRDGIDGWHLHERSPQYIGKWLSHWLEPKSTEDLAQMAQRAHNRIKESYSVDVVGPQIINFYNQILNEL